MQNFREDNLPKARFYYLEDDNGELGLSDLYSWEGHGYYLAPQILLAVFYGKRLSDFKETYDIIVNEKNSCGFWCNMASNSYKKYVTFEGLLAEVDLDKAIDNLKSEGYAWSDRQDRYVNIE